MRRVIFMVVAIVLTVNVFANDKKESVKKTESSNMEMSTAMIQGAVIDQITGEALTGVKVSIEGTNEIAYTDFDGNFTFNSVLKGEYNINVNYISYKANRLQKVKADGAVNSIKIGLVTVNE